VYSPLQKLQASVFSTLNYTWRDTPGSWRTETPIKNSLACIITSYYGKNTYTYARSRLSCQLFGNASWTLQFINTMFIRYGLLILSIIREGGSSVLTGSDLMNFWDRLCETLAVRFVLLLIYNSLICVFRCMLCCSAVWAVDVFGTRCKLCSLKFWIFFIWNEIYFYIFSSF
jgi:hypothetical protein